MSRRRMPVRRAFDWRLRFTRRANLFDGANREQVCELRFQRLKPSQGAPISQAVRFTRQQWLMPSVHQTRRTGARATFGAWAAGNLVRKIRYLRTEASVRFAWATRNLVMMMCLWIAIGLSLVLLIGLILFAFLTEKEDDETELALRRLRYHVARLQRHSNRLEIEVRRQRGLAWVSQSKVLTESRKMSADLSQEIEAITAAVTVIDSAIVLVRSIPDLIATAVAAAVENGATAEQLQPFTELSDILNEKQAELAQAMLANTPAE